ncbi:MAG: ABC transporter permease [Candidatus Krumholzibacteriia bacterium]
MTPRLILAVVGLRLRRILADRGNVIWLLVMPLVFTFLMGELMGDWSPTAVKPTLRVYGLDQADRGLAGLVARLGEDPEFQVDARDSTSTAERARWLLDNRAVSGVLLIGPGFADSLATGQRPHLGFFFDSDRSGSQSIRRAFDAAFARLSVRSAAITLVDARQAAADPAYAAAFDDSVYQALLDEPRVRLETRVRGRAKVDDLVLTDSRQHSAPSYTLMFMLMFMLMGAKDLVLERRNRTLDRLRLSHASPSDLIAGFFLASFILGLVQGAVLLTVNGLWIGIDYGDSPAALVLVMVLFAAVSAAAGLLLGTLAGSGGQADGLGMVFGLGLPALGGLWWPLEVTPPFMQQVGRLLPTGQAISVFHDLIGRGDGVAQVAPMLVGLGVWLTVLLVLAVVSFRRRLVD